MSLHEKVLFLEDEIRTLIERVKGLETTPTTPNPIQIKLARQVGAASGGLQPVILMDADRTDRQLSAVHQAEVLSGNEVLVADFQRNLFEISSPAAPALLIRATTDEAITDGNEGDITVEGSGSNPETGVWDHATGGLDLSINAEIWVQLRSDGKYDILGPGCDGVS